MNVGQILTLTANKFPNRTAIIFENVRFTYQEFNWRANQFAHSLLQLGLKKGEKVAVLLFNSNQFVEIYFATAKVGGVFTPINFRFAPEEVRYIVDHSDARIFLFGEEFSDLVETIRPKLTKVEFFISVRDGVAKGDLDYEALLKEPENTEPTVRLSEKDECQLMYTSGTTGRPKGAIITHGNVLWNGLPSEAGLCGPSPSLLGGEDCG